MLKVQAVKIGLAQVSFKSDLQEWDCFMSEEDDHSKKEDQPAPKVRLSINWPALEAEAETTGRPFRDLLTVQMERVRQKRREKTENERKKQASIPKVFYEGMFHLRAGRMKVTLGQLFRNVLAQGETKETPEDIQNWYAKIAGDFAKPPLADLAEDIYRRVLKDEPKLVASLDEAIRSGDIKWLEALTCCVAFIHRIPYAGNGQARRVAGATARNVMLAFTRLFEERDQRPSASEIRVEMARHACYLENDHQPPKFSDVWYLLRSGPKDHDEPGPSSRYEVTGIKNIKKTLKSLKVALGQPLRGPLTAKKVKSILDRWQLRYVDDLESVP
jgi:hypothetical protein